MALLQERVRSSPVMNYRNRTKWSFHPAHAVASTHWMQLQYFAIDRLTAGTGRSTCSILPWTMRLSDSGLLYRAGPTVF